MGKSRIWDIVMCYYCYLIVICFYSECADIDLTEEQLAEYIHTEYESEMTEFCNRNVIASWDHNVDLTNETKTELMNNLSLELSKFQKDTWQNYFKDVKYENFKNESLKRQMTFLTILGQAALNDSMLTELNRVLVNMDSIYSTGKICPYTKQDCNISIEGLPLDPGIEEILVSSRDYDELAYVWKAWRDSTGPNMKEDYKKYVELSNAAAVENGFTDNGAYWRKDYESDTFVEDLDQLWEEVKPLYDELHKYVRRKLRQVYGDKMGQKDDELIPAHLLGNMWAQQWQNIYDIVKPYPDATALDVTSSLQNQGYTALRMFETSNDFFQSLGLPTNNMSYDTTKAMIERPSDGREVVCHASAWDFCDGKDYRIKMCTKINSDDFITIHHEMGHIQYFIQYNDQPYIFRGGANPGFHEAVGDTIALSVSTPQHLQKIGLLQDYAESEENDINALMLQALERVAFLPFGLLIDKWRWEVFNGTIQPDQWNSRWWELREHYQKVKAPVPRSEEDFDPGAKYHVPGDSQYIAYFVAHVLQFQFHKALCIEAKEYNPADPLSKPLHQCDIYQSEEAGSKLSEGLSLGLSKHWSETLYIMTGERTMNGSAMLEYFQPLHEYLVQANENFDQNSEPTAEDQVVPITVGAVLGALMIVVLVSYFFMRRKKRSSLEEQAILSPSQLQTASPTPGQTANPTPGYMTPINPNEMSLTEIKCEVIAHNLEQAIPERLENSKQSETVSM